MLHYRPFEFVVLDAGGVDIVRHWRRTTGEDSNSGHILVMSLQFLEELLEFRTTEMRHGTQPGEERTTGNAFHIALADILFIISI